MKQLFILFVTMTSLCVYSHAQETNKQTSRNTYNTKKSNKQSADTTTVQSSSAHSAYDSAMNKKDNSIYNVDSTMNKKDSSMNSTIGTSKDSAAAWPQKATNTTKDSMQNNMTNAAGTTIKDKSKTTDANGNTQKTKTKNGKTTKSSSNDQ